MDCFGKQGWSIYALRQYTKRDASLFSGATGYSNAYFGEGEGPVNLDSVQCSGSEYNLTECEIGNSGTRTTHSRALDVGVKCQPGLCNSYSFGE